MADQNKNKISFLKDDSAEGTPPKQGETPASPESSLPENTEILEKITEADPFESQTPATESPNDEAEEASSPADQDAPKEKSKLENPFSKKRKQANTQEVKEAIKEEKNEVSIDVSSAEEKAADEPGPLKIEADDLPKTSDESLSEEAPKPALASVEIDPDPVAIPEDQPKIVLEPEKPVSEKKISFGEQEQDGSEPSSEPAAEIKTETTAEPPAEIENTEKEQPPSKNLSAQKLLFGFLGLGGLFVFLFYIIVFWGTMSGNASNPLFETLGVASGDLQSLLVTMTNAIFGLFSLVALIITLTFLFRAFMAEKSATNRRQLFTTTGIYFIAFVFGVGLWVFLYWFISNLSSGPAVHSGTSLIETLPKSVIDLDAPVRVEFSISDKLNGIIRPENLRQINWDFNEDGVYDASGPRVSHRFIDKGLNNGIYNVKAYIRYFSEKKGEEELYETARQIVINNEAVLAVLTATPQSGTYPLDVELSGLESKDPDGSIVWYEWDLDGDGTFEIRKEVPTIKKTFETVGEHKVVLRVTGTNTDDYDVMETVINVKNPEGSLRAEISTDGVSEGYSPLKISFDGSNSFVKEGKIVRYEWLLDSSDEPFVGRKMEKIFREPGEYEVRLIIQNDLGEKHETKKIITVLEDEAIANVIIDTTPPLLADQEVLRGIVPFEVTFNAEYSQVKDAFEWQWDFEDDGIVDEFALATKHIFRKPGIYDVKLSIVDANEKLHEKIQRVIVEKAGVRAKISADPNAGEVPLQIAFDGSGSSTDEGTIVDYIWEFPGAEPIHYGSKISYLFKQIGNFPVKLTILTSTGKIATTETIVSSRAPNVRSEFLFSPKIGSAPLNVTFNPSSSKGLVREYLWDFGDGIIQKQFRAVPIEHLYKKEGEYIVKLRLVDDNGVVSSSEQTVEVRPSKN